MMKKVTFPEYWSVAKSLQPEARTCFFSSFSKQEQKQIKRSYQQGGWKDVFLRNQIDELCDLVKEIYDIDLFDLRIKITRKKVRILISRVLWDDIMDQFSEYDNCFNLYYVFGEISSKIYPLSPNFYELYLKE